MTDVFLYAGEVNPSDVKLRDPTTTGGKIDYVLTCAVGTYAYSGIAASLKVSHSLVCSAGSYSYIGVAASLKVAHSLQCLSGAYSYTGNAATLMYVPGAAKVDYVLSCDAGTYAYSGQQATLTYVSGQQVSGGFEYYKGHPWIDGPIRKYIEEVEPEIVEAVIEVVAKVTEHRTVQNKDVEAAQAEKALREILASQHQTWKEMYAQLIRLEYERREQEYEDAQIAMLLFDL